jgi:aspartyl-tRNA(Asn)/glutamyl-tRNA(Gln) amidotransferase subunit A
MLLNAFAETAAAGAAAAAAPATALLRDGVLRGCAVAVKANLCAQGWRATAGSRALERYTAPYSATAVERLLGAGATIAGVTNMDEFGMGSATAFSVHGPTYSPYSALHALLRGAPRALDAQRARAARSWLTPGGSSGGSAVAVATGAAAVALGSDTGGSVRQPAAFCGVVGFKPSYGRIPRWGLIAYASSLDTVALLARDVGGAALAYDVAAGHDPRDDTSLRTPPAQRDPLAHWRGGAAAAAVAAGGASGGGCVAPPAYALLRSRRDGGGGGGGCGDGAWSLAGLRVGLPREYHAPGLEPALERAWQAAAGLLQAHGAELVPVSLPHTAAALPAYYIIAPAEAASNLSRYDGVRYGHRAEAAAADAAAAGGDAAGALHAEYTRTRTEGFGAEVRRRVLVGNYVLSAGARGAYYDSACVVRARVAADFDAVFRRRPAWPGDPDAAAASLAAAAWTGGPPRALGRADAATGVDVLLTPTSPVLPWRSADTADRDPLAVYAGDVRTVPASLAGLPAVSVPVGTAAYPPELFAAALSDARALLGERGAPSDAAVERVRRALCLPTGVQLIGRYLDEDTLLRVACVLERAAGFAPPAYVAAADTQPGDSELAAAS